MSAIEVTNLHKTYKLGKVEVPVLRGVSLQIQSGEWLAILGASGSGKSTLLHLLGGLDRPDSKTGGRITYDGKALGDLSASERNQFRRDHVGFVFQFYHLVPELTVMENTLLGAMIRLGKLGYMREAGKLKESARELLGKAGLSHRLGHKPSQLSGGERQRVAIARALINDPPVLLADEPTGNLDQKTGAELLDVFESMRGKTERTIVMVTHDPKVARRADRVVEMADGLIRQPTAAEAAGA
ncbi:MAG: ABC transporter ATP-binding protein [Phycisphaerales bacterium JB061]